MVRLFSFRDDRRGNVAIIFALSLVPLFGMVGAAVDFTRAASVQARLQAALDAASLAVAKDSRLLSGAGLAEAANRAFSANWTGQGDTALGALRVTKTGGTVRIEVEGSVRTSVSAAVGIDSIPLKVVSQTSWNEPRIEIALVLDNTTSMSWSGKMPALKQAVRELLADLEASRLSAEQVRVALVPFAMQVNIGTALRDEPWLRFDADGLPASLATTRAAWQGCLTDRDQPADTTDAAPASKATRYRAARCATAGLARVQPLSSHFGMVRTAVEAMQPAGTTNITIGLQMGAAVLSRGQPFTEASAAPDVLRYMILLTDGDNTESRYVAFNANTPAIDARTRLACEAVKGAGVTLFTVRVIEGNAALLRACATSPAHYFNVTSAGGIGEAFRSITSMIKRLRLSV